MWQITYPKWITRPPKQDAKQAQKIRKSAINSVAMVYTLQTQSAQHNPPQCHRHHFEQANASWYVSCYYPNNHHLIYPHSDNGFNDAKNVAYNMYYINSNIYSQSCKKHHKSYVTVWLDNLYSRNLYMVPWYGTLSWYLVLIWYLVMVPCLDMVPCHALI